MTKKRKFQIILFIVAVIVAVGMAVVGVVNYNARNREPSSDRQQVYWYMEEDGHLDIYGRGDMTQMPWTSFHRDNILRVTIGDEVTSIAPEAFLNCTNLRSVSMGTGVASVGEKAFSGCTSLTHVSLSSRVTSLGDGAFAGCHALQSVYISTELTHMGADVFYDCEVLTDVYYLGTQAQWEALTANYADDPVLSGLTVHYEYVSRALTYRSNQDGTCTVTGMGDGTSTAVLIPSIAPGGEAVTAIGEGAFENCVSLTAITLPAGITTIGDRAFAGCVNLRQVSLPSGVSVLGKEVFAGCSSLIHISMDVLSEEMQMGERAFAQCTSLTSVKIPDGMTRLPSGWLQGCASLAEVTMHEGVTEIGDGAFDGCIGLTDVHYEGSSQAFAAIAMGTANQALTEAKIHYYAGIPAGAIRSLNIRLVSGILLNFYVDLQPIQEDAYMRFTMGDHRVEVSMELAEDGRYVYPLKDVEPQYMGDNIIAELIWNDQVMDTKEYCLLTFFEDKMTSTAGKLGISKQKYEALQTLLSDILVWGAQAQIQNGYRTDALVTDRVADILGRDLTPSTVLPTPLDDVTQFSEVAVEGIAFNDVSLSSDHGCRIALDFRVASDALLVVKKGGEIIHEVSYAGSDQVREYLTDTIYTLGFDAVYTFELYALHGGGRELSQTLTYSVNSYAYRVHNEVDENGEPTARAQMALALYRYGVSAETYQKTNRPVGSLSPDGDGDIA